MTMRLRRLLVFFSSPLGLGVLFLAGVLAGSGCVQAQTFLPPGVLAAEATPIGALPPVALPMPASRDQSYFGLRLQTGSRMQRGPEDLLAIALGVDYQVSGGSIFGVTGGYQWRQHCQPVLTDCGGHSLYGARARFNLMTGGPTIARLWGDNSATSTLGTELGLGYAPKARAGVNACTLDLGLPLSIAMLERIRLVSFVTPGVVWDVNCSAENTPGFRTFLIGFGLGLQQLGFRGLDVHVGAQRMFRGSTGLQFGITISWVRLP
jgi:hypothetical protein